jgi:apolipoprotein N-acyltransferase
MTPAQAGDAAAVPAVPRRIAVGLAAFAGALTVFGFAPFGWKALPVATLAVLLALWQRTPRARDAAAIGFAFGLGLFGAGVSWLYIALQTFGGMPAPLAAIAIAGLVAFLSLYPALAGAIAVRVTPRASVSRLLAAAAAFVLAEWLRGWLFSGFPWLSIGYSQVPGSALSGFAPVGGVWLVSLAVAACAALLVVALDGIEARRWGAVVACIGAACLVVAAGGSLRKVAWTAPSGSPLPVSLVQGNVAQDLKFDPAFRERTFALYGALAESSRGRLVVLPESAFPMFADELPRNVVVRLANAAQARGGNLLFGVFLIDPPLAPGGEPRVYNSVVSVGGERPEVYRKRHLVPFGETIPLKPLVGWVMDRLLAIPIGDQTPGPAEQPPFVVDGERIAVNICYEDAFGEELRAGARDATMLVNVTNDAWYGRSIAARQHNQIAAMRALELGRPMLRATNTGITSAIGHDGRVFAELPWFTRGILEVEVTGRRGETPYLRFGDALPVALAALLLAAGAIAGVRARRRGLG